MDEHNLMPDFEKQNPCLCFDKTLGGFYTDPKTSSLFGVWAMSYFFYSSTAGNCVVAPTRKPRKLEIKDAKPCFNCKEKPAYISRTPDNEDRWAWTWEEGVVGEPGYEHNEYGHLLIHDITTCSYGAEIYHNSIDDCVKQWNKQQEEQYANRR